ncbi:unnamed protein product [Onchocerca flexuosa]|uniref:Uncharacterized protein n=1 Tax=Onchocerca flexuosa TaxID=387005 RepID=A0A183HB56_9BILA|nr:unnamed protein product [Onchocerca flexuosa]
MKIMKDNPFCKRKERLKSNENEEEEERNAVELLVEGGRGGTKEWRNERYTKGSCKVAVNCDDNWIETFVCLQCKSGGIAANLTFSIALLPLHAMPFPSLFSSVCFGKEEEGQTGRKLDNYLSRKRERREILWPKIQLINEKFGHRRLG